MKVADLRALAEKRNIEGWESMSKPELKQALDSADKDPKNKPAESLPEEQPQPEEEEAEEDENEDEGPVAPRKPIEVPKSELIEPPQLLSQKARAMKIKLEGEKAAGLVETVFVNREASEPVGTVQTIGLNGYHLNIRKGEPVVVPQTVARFLWQMQKDSGVALEHKLKFNPGEKPELEQ